MQLLKHVSTVYKDFGISGIMKRVIAILISRVKKGGRNIRTALRSNKYGFYYNLTNLKKDWRLTRETQATMRENQLRSLDQLDINRFKRSERVFILGSGASVNDLTDQNLNHIRNCNSIGFNSWVAHPLVPDIYFVEPPIVSLQIWKDWTTLYEYKKDQYGKIPFVVNFKEWQHHLDKFPMSDLPLASRINLYHYAPFDLRLNNPILISLVLWYWGLCKSSKRSMDDLIHQRATLATLIMFSLFAGFKEIVLVGVDLNDTAYFFETTDKKYDYKPVNVQTGTIHRTVDPTLDINNVSIPIDEYIYLLDRILLKPRRISLFVASDKSRLFPRIPKYQFPTN